MLDEGAEARLAGLARAPVALRRALARVAGRMVATRGWERLGFARAADYAAERAGLSSREWRDLAAVDRALADLPRLEAAFLARRIGWTQLRLLCRVARPEDEERWLAFASRLTARALAREVRAVDRRAREAAGGVGAPDSDDETRVGVLLRSSLRAQGCWWHARRVASRVAGQRLSPEAVAEAVAAEVLSAVPLDGEVADPAAAAPGPTQSDSCESARAASVPARGWQSMPAEPGAADAPPAFVAALEAELADAGAFELDARLRRAVCLEQQHLARVAALLAEVVAGGLHRNLGFRSVDHYVEERLSMSPSRARALLRIERAAAVCPPLREAFAAGELSWVQAYALVPLLLEPASTPHRSGWIAHAARVSVRRLRDEAERALAVGDFAPPPLEPDPSDPDPGPDRGSDANPAAQQTGADARLGGRTVRLFFTAPAEVAYLFRAALATVQRRLERARGRPSCESEALEAMLEHAIAVWEASERRPQRETRVYARDGWRCTAPGCSSYRNLQAHHVVFRSAGGPDDLANLTTLCAWHHQRGVHARAMLCTGTAPHGLRFELGVRVGRPPLAVYGPGEVRMA